MNNIVISFLKLHGIPYKIDRTSQLIRYVCFYCQSEAHISFRGASWECNSCGKEGTLVHLMHFIRDKDMDIEEIKNVELYDEEIEIKEIKKLLNQLGKDPVIQTIQLKLTKVFEQQKKRVP